MNWASRICAKPADYYGLGLALGGGEVSLEELARAYRSMAGARDDADLLVTDMLADPYARAASFGVDSILRLPFRAAVKTGTSSGHRDTWAAGFHAEYTVATWVGNFDGSPMRGVSGVSGAAPLWARIMLHLHERAEPPPFARRAVTCGVLSARGRASPRLAAAGPPCWSGCAPPTSPRGARFRRAAAGRVLQSCTPMTAIASPHSRERVPGACVSSSQRSLRRCRWMECPCFPTAMHSC